MTIPIRKIGSVLPVDDQGHLVNMSSVEKIKPPWSEVVESAKEAYLSHFGDEIHSIYVRGSVAKDTAIEGISDVDTLAVTNGSVVQGDSDWVNDFSAEVLKKFPFCQKVEIGVVPYGSLMDFNDDSYRSKRFTIKVQSVCIYGKDLASKIPPFRPGRDVARHAYVISKNLETLVESLSETEDVAMIKRRCVWIMKRLLRTGLELVMEQEQAYTRDLYPSYKIFSKYYPEHERDMRRVLELALNPASDKSIILGMVDGFGEWVSKEATRKFSA